MRSIWLASTAILISAGIACAQTASPAPTGPTSAPAVSPSTTASPGNLGSNAGSSSTGSMGSASNATSAPGGTTTPSPAPNGAVNAPVETSQSPGKSAPAPGTSSSAAPMPSSAASMSAMSTPAKPMHHWSSTSALPENASATTYLHIAKSAINHHNVTLADDALSHAETQLLNRAVPQGQIAADDSPSIQSIESARKALQAGNYSQASMDTKQASMAVSAM